MQHDDDGIASDRCRGTPPVVPPLRRAARPIAVAALAMVLAAAAPAVAADAVPVWQRLLRWAGGDSSATPVPNAIHQHMQMSLRSPVRPGDAERAAAIVAAARRVLERYRDVETAERDGYRAFAPRHLIGEEVHYTNSWKAGREKKTLDLERPGSILYKRTGSGLVAVGVMYTADAEAGPEQLDSRLPLSIAVWHRHVNFCGWPDAAPRVDWDGPNARFGVAGSIDSEAACAQAGGYWIPLVLGWLTHVFPFECDPERVWLGEHAMQMAAPDDEHAAGHDAGHPHSEHGSANEATGGHGHRHDPQ